MYLKSIEVQGFKSFANKIVFQFHNGITGIVGPNGSGKSNVADAVRWVLGEQRVKQLRGASMQDVIFSGTELRKPQGFAYVAITLDNSDHQLPIEFDEVTVSRRVYRSGESEYKINGNACRLKDINELFYDTGIGKEGYSIIGQGQIDKILSGKPEDRRELFDEAAGIVKFKRRKVITQKKLEDEKQNLVRVNDILSELEKQVGPLKRQSEAAREYLRLRESLKTFDVNLFLLESEEVRRQLEAAEKNEAIVSADLSQVKESAEQMKREYDEISGLLAKLEESINQNREEMNRADLLKGNLEGQIGVLTEQINTERISAEHIGSRLMAIDREIGERQEKKAAYEAEKETLSAQQREVGGRLKELRETLRRTEEQMMLLDQRMEDSKADIIRALNEKAGLSARQQRYATLLEQVDVRRAEVSQKLLHFKSDESVWDEKIGAEALRLTEVEDQLRAVEKEESETVLKRQASEEELRRLNRNLSNAQQDYHTSQTKLESLRNLAERYEGYGGSIRRVMEARDRIYGIHGVVADLITVQKKYEVAIETALGGSIQNIVTDTEQTAKQLIEYLKKNRFGRATFLPLTSIGNKSTFSQERALKEPGVLGLANTLVETKPEYEGLMKYLLGRVVVADNIDHAIALAKKYQYSLRIVTLEGELLNAGGSMTGGAFKNSSNLLGRKREIEDLEERCKKILVQVEEIQKELNACETSLEEQKSRIEELASLKQQIYLEQNTLQLNIRQMEEKKAEISQSSEDLVMENGQLEEQLRDIHDSQERLKAEAVELEELNDRKNREIEEWSRESDQLKERRGELLEKVSAVQLEESEASQKVHFMDENISRVDEEIGKLSEESEGLKNGTGDSDRIINEKLSEIENLKGLIGNAAAQSEALALQVREQTESREAHLASQKEFFEKREEAAGRMGLLDKELFRLQSQKEKLSERLESQSAYMWSEYEITYSDAESLRDPLLSSVPELKRQIGGLKQQIKALGNVNVNAIEDYKEISGRYEFMKTQHDDLVKAEETLLKIIEELDTGMRRQFEEKFKEIRREFDKVFKELFGGGHGTLELMEDEDILEAGIQIISQPPGKKLQNMMQLSGGEKALTAIALLFAIQNLKPSPFCLLDEIEAALDDSNVDRFAGYLHKLTANTQFIVITHRRGTMVASDRLYGITMQEKGVSTLVSVNLIENELDQ
ncbi:MAG TPA: chromosome segregation protein SMC [Candidatus Ventrisoma faecale]|nr:chromosome segregation protein SMC [Candidatus Ventrisoma faecale]